MEDELLNLRVHFGPDEYSRPAREYLNDWAGIDAPELL